MDAILLIFAIQLAVLLAFLALSVDFSKLSSRLTPHRVGHLLRLACSRSVSFCLRGFSLAEESLPESILETQPEIVKHRPNDSRVIVLESQQNSDAFAEEDEETAQTEDAEALECDLDMKSNELLASEFGLTRLFSRAFCWIFSIRATLFSNKRNVVSPTKNSTCSTKHVSTTSAAKKRNYTTGFCSTRAEMCTLNFRPEKVVTYSLRYKNDHVSRGLALLFRKKLAKLNFVIFKKKKTRPLGVIYEIPEEVY